MRSPPILHDDNSANEEQTAYSRNEARGIVRDHLNSHVQCNPGRSSDYVTWVATLHPENAEVSIDQRFFVPGNPWWTIYENAKNEIPTATAVAVDEELGGAQSSPGTGTPSSPQAVSMAAGQGKSVHPPLWMIISPVSIFGGILVVFHAVLGVLISELFALFLCYIPGWLLFQMASAVDYENACAGIFHSFFMAFYYVCALADSICLMASVIVTEVVSFAGWLVGFLTGGVLMGRFWHQYTRRICHGIRIALRNKKCFRNPSRHFVQLCGVNKDDKPEEFYPTVEPIVVGSDSVGQLRNTTTTSTPGIYATAAENISSKS